LGQRAEDDVTSAPKRVTRTRVVVLDLSRLAAAGVLKDKSCSAYPAVGPEVRAAGGRFVDVPPDRAPADGNLVSAPAWPAHPQWLAAFLKGLGSRIEP
jgi:protease I